MDALKYLFVGLEGHHNLVPFMWLFAILAVAAIVLLLPAGKLRSIRVDCGSTYWLTPFFAAGALSSGLGPVRFAPEPAVLPL